MGNQLQRAGLGPRQQQPGQPQQQGPADGQAHLQVNAVGQQQLQFPQGLDVRPPPVRDFRPRRYIYSRAQKDRAIRLLNMGIPCRQVARMIGPRCSSGTPIRWRQIARRQAEARRRLEEMMRQRRAN